MLNIWKTAGFIRENAGNTNLIFRVITLSEPPKAELVKFLELESLGHPNATYPSRIAKVQTYQDGVLHEYKVDVNLQTILDHQVLHGRHSYIDPEFMRKVEAACLADSHVQEEIKAQQLPKGAVVVVEPWAYATDGMNDMRERVTMVRTCQATLAPC